MMATLLRLVSLTTLAACAQGPDPGAWRIAREVDAMTDKPSCVGSYEGNARVVLTARALAIAFPARMEVETVKIRVDDGTPEDFVLSPLHRRQRAVLFSDDSLSRLLHGGRLRVRFVADGNQIVDDDIELRGAREALAKLASNECE